MNTQAPAPTERSELPGSLQRRLEWPGVMLALAGLAAGCGGAPTHASGDGARALPADRAWARAVASPHSGDGAASSADVQVSAGLVHTCALRGGEVWCWGDNREGELGDRARTPRHAPRRVPGIDDAVSVAAGQSVSCAVRRSGEVWCWGDNRLGQLGDGGASSRSEPGPVAGLDDATLVAAGAWSVCAIHGRGAVSCWGREGTLSEPPHAIHREPRRVPGLDDAVQLSVGGNHACAVRRTGQVACWGDNTAFQLGDGTREFRARPHVLAAIDDATGVLAGSLQSCALRRSGAVVCWGNVALNTDAVDPEPVPNLSDAVRISGMYDPCAIRATGEVVCWGHDEHGQAVETRRGPPAAVPVSGVRDALQISATNHVCVVVASGDVSCWGANEYGEVGVDPRLVYAAPTPLGGGVDDAIDLYAGGGQTCALTRAGEVRCAGGEPEGVHAIEGLRDVRGLTGGPSAPCALHADGSVSCWSRWASPFGGCTGSTSREPGRFAGLRDVVEVAGDCALLRGGRVLCWAGGDRMHPPPDACVPQPTEVSDGRALVVGARGWCVLHRDGGVSCTQGGAEDPGGRRFARVAGLSEVVGLSAGEDHACAVRQDGRVLCWGENRLGQLGDGTTEARARPVEVEGVDDAVEVAAGNRMFTCARRRGGRVVCWGLTERIPRRPPPRMVTLELEDAVQLAAGPEHACARRARGEVVCWGTNSHGEFGVLPAAHVGTPVVVSP